MAAGDEIRSGRVSTREVSRRPILVIRGLEKRYGPTTALAGVDLQVPRGSIYGLVGLNGAGKTTALECVLGLERPDAGELELFGAPVRGVRRADPRLSAVFDEPCMRRALRLETELRHAFLLCDGCGRTPDEVYLGDAVDLPERLAAKRDTARRERLALNRSRTCGECSPSQELMQLPTHRNNDLRPGAGFHRRLDGVGRLWRCESCCGSKVSAEPPVLAHSTSMVGISRSSFSSPMINRR